MSLRNLPYHELATAAGLASNIHPRAAAGRALTLASNVDTFDKFQTIGKLPGSSAVSPDHGASVESLHQFEFTDLAGDRQYHQISLAGGEIRRINSPSLLTVLTRPTGVTLSNAPLSEARVFDRLHLTGAEQRGCVTGGVKYDGNGLSNWGVLAPGKEETVKEAMDSASGWSISPDATLTTSSTSQDGVASLAMSKTGTSATDAYIFKPGLAMDLSTAGSDIAFQWVFLPAGTLQKLATSGAAVQVSIGDGALVNADHHSFTVGELLPGWNLLSMVLTAPDSQDGTGATLASIDTLRLRLIFSASSQTVDNVLWDQLVVNSEGRLTAAVGAAGNVNATVSYRVSFLTEYGVESNGGPISASVVPANQQVDLTAVPVSTDGQVIARRIYRDLDGDRIYRFVGQIDDNLTTTFTDNVADASLGAATLPLSGDTSLDSTPPERMRAVTVHENRVFGINADNPVILHISDVNQPELFPLVNELQFDEELVALESHGLGLLLYGHDKVYLLTGNGVSTTFRADLMSPQHGANTFRSVVPVKTLHMAVRESEAHLLANPTDPWLLNGVVLDQWRDGGFTDGFAVHDRSRFRVVFVGKSSGSSTFDTIWTYQYGTSGQQQISGEGAGVDPQDIRAGFWHKMSLPVEIKTLASVESSDEILELWGGGADGYVYHISDPDQTDYANGASTSPVSAELEWAAVPLGDDETGRGEARYLTLMAECSAVSTWTITVSLMTDVDGADLLSTTKNVVLPVGKSSPIVSLPSVGMHGRFAKIKLTNANAGEDGRFSRVRLHYKPRGDFRGEAAA